MASSMLRISPAYLCQLGLSPPGISILIPIAITSGSYNGIGTPKFDLREAIQVIVLSQILLCLTGWDLVDDFLESSEILLRIGRSQRIVLCAAR